MKRTIETDRLFLWPLNAKELALLIEDKYIFEQTYHCAYRGEPLDGVFGKILAEQLDKVKNEPENYLWHSFWMLLRKNDRTIIGAIDFKGVPNPAGNVEIGYGLNEAFQHNGYMTEAAQAFCCWALKQDKVKRVIAETETDNIQSQKVLKRCGFQKYHRDTSIWWQLCEDESN